MKIMQVLEGKHSVSAYYNYIPNGDDDREGRLLQARLKKRRSNKLRTDPAKVVSDHKNHPHLKQKEPKQINRSNVDI